MDGDGFQGSQVELLFFYALCQRRHGDQVRGLVRCQGIGMTDLLGFEKVELLPEQLHHPLVAVNVVPQLVLDQGPYLL